MDYLIYKKNGLIFNTLSEYYFSKENNRYNGTKQIKEHNYNLRPLINPVYNELCKTITNLENGLFTLLTPSCMNSIFVSIIATYKKNSCIVIADNIYKQTKKTIIDLCQSIDFTFKFFDPTNYDSINASITSNTSIVIVENPCSYTYNIIDTDYISKISHKNNAILICDNSSATPIFHKPLNHGADIVVCSVGKYINGRRDTVMGYITTKTIDIYKKIYNTIVNSGIIVNYDDCYNVLNSISTLKIRMQHHNNTVNNVVNSIKNNEKISLIMHPTTDINKNLYDKYFTGSGSVFSIAFHKMYDIQDLDVMISNMKYFKVGTTWGGDISLVIDFKIEDISQKMKQILKDKSLLRFYCGLEDWEHLSQDIINGINAL